MAVPLRKEAHLHLAYILERGAPEGILPEHPPKAPGRLDDGAGATLGARPPGASGRFHGRAPSSLGGVPGRMGGRSRGPQALQPGGR